MRLHDHRSETRPPVRPGEAWHDDDGFRSFTERHAETGDRDSAADWASLGFEIVKAVVTPFTKGGVTTNFGTREMGVRKPDKPKLQYHWARGRKRVFSYRTATLVGIETVNLKLDAHIRYNGPEVLLDLRFPAGGRRSRLGSETRISVGNILPYKTIRAPEAWRRLGIAQFPVIEVPFDIFVDEPWPNPNWNETFSLILSGFHGFGAPGIRSIINRRTKKN